MDLKTRLKGRVAIVVGGASGMGKATAHRLVQEGARIVIVDRDDAAAKAAAEEIGAQATHFSANVTDEASMEAAVAYAANLYGQLDIAVNAAGVGASVALVNQTVEQFKQIQDINLTGVFIACKAEARQMITQGQGGVIVNFASTNAVQPAEGLAAYCASKAGVAMFTQVAAMELSSNGIRVVGIGPGLTDTPMVQRVLSVPGAREAFTENILLKRPGRPEEIAASVAFLVSDDASYITGSTLYVEGGSLTQRYPELSRRQSTQAPVVAGGSR
ncbi:MAG TPA: SDR family oxidoreductase [Paraburkholderia sp.]|uniref:SDR family NAD(P)-dependent oxidoreductase n=1 Tax=Paraburkholderia sp. TaxID=1926495 RepID=UPI002B4A4D09|nr:SDR family oxidoreductase [Paraburkholderia sp.]HKR46710.1 SDR family oxidoreductase [Paraburkholderia sp.]